MRACVCFSFRRCVTLPPSAFLTAPSCVHFLSLYLSLALARARHVALLVTFFLLFSCPYVRLSPQPPNSSRALRLSFVIDSASFLVHLPFHRGELRTSPCLTRAFVSLGGGSSLCRVYGCGPHFTHSRTVLAHGDSPLGHFLPVLILCPPPLRFLTAAFFFRSFLEYRQLKRLHAGVRF